MNVSCSVFKEYIKNDPALVDVILIIPSASHKSQSKIPFLKLFSVDSLERFREGL